MTSFYTPVFRRDVLWYGDVLPGLRPSVRPSAKFSTLFSYMLWHFELKFGIWLCFWGLQIKFECRLFPSIFVWVMPLFELRILKINSFLHFSPACFDILMWNFVYDFGFMNLRSSSSIVKNGHDGRIMYRLRYSSELLRMWWYSTGKRNCNVFIRTFSTRKVN